MRTVDHGFFSFGKNPLFSDYLRAFTRAVKSGTTE